MTRRALLALLALSLSAAAALAFAPDYYRQIARARLSDVIPVLAPALPDASLPASAWVNALIAHAEQQIGVTTTYDGAYVALDYPGGDIDRARGVCTDVIIRALRDAHGIDVQKLVHEDMRRAFSDYPANWGLSRPDRNIDHRRVPNLRRFLTRHGMALPSPDDETKFEPGDIVTWTLGPGLPHIGIVSNRLVQGTERPQIIHNVGAGTRSEDFLYRYPITGHYRLEGKI